ncbi:MAG: ROK family transcriptional regulator [Propionibacteriaceae bacterium]|jgi:predicted NBD/HSP70 family sugar kinase|nr:ROK family transcriptional regulator [Propionibacteriaceae bacterium]
MQFSAKADMTRSAVLTFIGGHGPASRTDLARVLGVSPALVTQVTKGLLDDGLITELESSPSKGGRPARLLGLASAAGSVIGAKVAADHVTVVEAGIDGGVLRSATEPFRASAPGSLVALTAILRGFIEGGVSPRLLGIGLAVPGSVDQQSVGTVESTQLGWNGVPVGATLRHEFDLPVLVDNNVNALATAEVLYGQARGHADALVVTIGTGVGAGLIIDGAVFRGHSGAAGEIGHIPTVEGGPLCQCGAQGCLEAVIGQQGLVNSARSAGVIGSQQGIDALRIRADHGDARAQEILTQAGRRLGRALAGVVNTIDPEVVIVLGEGVAAWRHWMYGFEPAFRSAVVPARRGVPVAVETWQDDRWAQGAACLVLGTPFDAQGVSGDQGEWVRQRLTDVGSSSDLRRRS